MCLMFLYLWVDGKNNVYMYFNKFSDMNLLVFKVWFQFFPDSFLLLLLLSLFQSYCRLLTKKKREKNSKSLTSFVWTINTAEHTTNNSTKQGGGKIHRYIWKQQYQQKKKKKKNKQQNSTSLTMIDRNKSWSL